MRIDHEWNNDTIEKFEMFEDIVFADIGLCGCGDPDAVLDMIQAYLEIKASDNFGMLGKVQDFTEKYKEELLLFMMYTLDKKGFTEHGTSINTAWITYKGKKFLELLQEEV